MCIFTKDPFTSFTRYNWSLCAESFQQRRCPLQEGGELNRIVFCLYGYFCISFFCDDAVFLLPSLSLWKYRFLQNRLFFFACQKKSAGPEMPNLQLFLFALGEFNRWVRKNWTMVYYQLKTHFQKGKSESLGISGLFDNSIQCIRSI